MYHASRHHSPEVQLRMYIVTACDETPFPHRKQQCCIYLHLLNLLSSVALQDLQGNCSGIREMTRNLLTPGSPKSHVGIYGNSNPLIPSQWVPILLINPPVPENQVYDEVYSMALSIVD